MTFVMSSDISNLYHMHACSYIRTYKYTLLLCSYILVTCILITSLVVYLHLVAKQTPCAIIKRYVCTYKIKCKRYQLCSSGVAAVFYFNTTYVSIYTYITFQCYCLHTEICLLSNTLMRYIHTIHQASTHNTHMYICDTPSTLKICSNHLATGLPFYIETEEHSAHYDNGILFERFRDISIVIVLIMGLYL